MLGLVSLGDIQRRNKTQRTAALKEIKESPKKSSHHKHKSRKDYVASSKNLHPQHPQMSLNLSGSGGYKQGSHRHHSGSLSRSTASKSSGLARSAASRRLSGHHSTRRRHSNSLSSHHSSIRKSNTLRSPNSELSRQSSTFTRFSPTTSSSSKKKKKSPSSKPFSLLKL